ncbi:MAG TPA: hypothetical protein VFQ00_13475 [Terriglobales bacterium]|nr:hypothetical protein [Terriglobales bacterium]
MSLAASLLRSQLEKSLENRIPHALTPPPRSAPERMLTGIAAIDALTGGIPLGCLTEICGPASSGRTSVLLAVLAQCLRRDEICALIDASDAFDPQSAAAAGVDLGRLLWVRGRESGHRVIGSSGEAKTRAIGYQRSTLGRQRAFIKGKNLSGQSTAREFQNARFTSPDGPITRWPGFHAQSSALEQSLKATDLLLQAGGFGAVVLDLGDIDPASARRIPLTTWFRFRRAVEHTSTALIVIEQEPHAKSCASLVLDFAAQATSWSETSEAGTMVGVYSGENPAPAFFVNARGVAVPFGEPTASSFEMPQRWSTPHTRLLNAVHVHFEVARARSTPQKFGAQPDLDRVILRQAQDRLDKYSLMSAFGR